MEDLLKNVKKFLLKNVQFYLFIFKSELVR